ncbi:MAG: beta-ketoacyl synthase N-terminal-like domain-containing protein [Saprospiraceae bacterium]|nr:beta-ketoacyl synthase N-terminal-like domain-containing protein [Saprospiraceae bacterium]MDZ4703034.1 beta-ketoacyl synthase N-terminal-like domain-containing protein [Saprospiraceae bacterium]
MKSIPQNERIVITGVGMVSSIGIGAETYYQSLKSGQSGVVIKNTWNESGLDQTYFYPCPEINIKEYFADLKAPFPLRYSQLAMLGCQTAVKSAKLEGNQLSPDRIGLILNTSMAANAAVEAYLEKLFREGPRKASPFDFTKTVSNTVLGDTTRYYKFRGSSSLLMGEDSVCYGFDLLKNDDADIIICGGFDEIRDIHLIFYNESGYLLDCPSENADTTAETTLKRALDYAKNERKTVIGEAAAFVVLEKLDHALERGADIYAEVLNYNTGFDGAHDNFFFEKNEADFKHVMEESLKLSGLAPSDIDCVVGASCLPWQYNEYEGKAIDEIWKNEDLYYTTIKPFIGETFGASGQTSLVAAALMMQNEEVLGTGWAGSYFNNPTNARVTIPGETLEHVPLEKVMVNSIQAGGNTTSIILSRYN